MDVRCSVSFQYESHMLGIVVDQLPESLRLGAPVAVASELPLSHRRVDLGLLPVGAFRQETGDLPVISHLGAEALWGLAVVIWLQTSGRDCISCDATALSYVRNAGASFAALQESGVLDAGGVALRQLSEFLTTELGPLVMVELKLHRWDEALRQAKFCSRAADLVCVVLDASRITDVPVEPFAEAGIGLLSARYDSIEVLVPAHVEHRYMSPQGVFTRLQAIRDLARRKPRKWMLHGAGA